MDGIVEEERKKGEEGRGSFLHHGSRTGKGREERNCRGGNGDPLRHSIFSWPFLLRREPPFSYQKIREPLSLFLLLARSIFVQVRRIRCQRSAWLPSAYPSVYGKKREIYSVNRAKGYGVTVEERFLEFEKKERYCRFWNFESSLRNIFPSGQLVFLITSYICVRIASIACLLDTMFEER